MDLIFVILYTAVGTVFGATAIWALMQRKGRAPGAEAELAQLRAQLQEKDAALTATTATAKDLRRELDGHDQVVERVKEEVKSKELDLEMVKRGAAGETAARRAAELRAEDLAIQLATLSEQHTALQARMREADSLPAGEAGPRVAALEVQLDDARRRVEELTGQIASLTSELNEQKSAEDARRSALETQLEAERRQADELTGQIIRLTAELKQQRCAEDARRDGERQQVEELNGQIARLTAELSQQKGGEEAQRDAERQRAGELTEEIARLTAELNQQRGGEEAQRDAERQRAGELSEEIARLTAELDNQKTAAGEHARYCASLEAQIEADRRQVLDLTEQFAQARAALGEQQHSSEQQLSAERERAEKLIDRIGQLETECAQLGARLREEKQAGMDRIELLSSAQASLSDAFRLLCADVLNGKDRASVEALRAAFDARQEAGRKEVLAHATENGHGAKPVMP